ncbi:MAG: hypothetical protein BJ554DRAFT_4153, partial [Olpidium bornovanus]
MTWTVKSTFAGGEPEIIALFAGAQFLGPVLISASAGLSFGLTAPPAPPAFPPAAASEAAGGGGGGCAFGLAGAAGVFGDG